MNFRDACQFEYRTVRLGDLSKFSVFFFNCMYTVEEPCYCRGPAVRQLMSPICLVTAQAAWEPFIPRLEPPCFVVSQV